MLQSVLVTMCVLGRAGSCNCFHLHQGIWNKMFAFVFRLRREQTQQLMVWVPHFRDGYPRGCIFLPLQWLFVPHMTVVKEGWEAGMGWGSKGMCWKRILPLAVVMLEKVQREGKRKRHTNSSLKCVKTESLLFFFQVKISHSLFL